MKKILILSYHFPPMNVIASQRSLGYAEHFKKFGLEPTIVTFDWTQLNEPREYISKSDIVENVRFESNSDYNLYTLPFAKWRISKLLKKLEQSFLSKPVLFATWVLGHLDATPDLLNQKKTEKLFIDQLLKKEKFDFVMGIFSPHFSVANAKWASNKFKIPLVQDYRDLWNNSLLSDEYINSRTRKIQYSIFSKKWKKWNKGAHCIGAVCEPIHDKLKILGALENSITLTNGYNQNYFKQSSEKSKHFTITHTGTLSKKRGDEEMVKGLETFVTANEIEDVRFVFIGALRNDFDNELIRRIEKVIPQDKLVITKRLSIEESISTQQKSHILLAPASKFLPGILSGKIFEYINAETKILSIPRDEAAISALIDYTSTGETCENSDDLASKLTKSLDEWRLNGVVEHKPNVSRIQEFSREKLSEKMAQFILRS